MQWITDVQKWVRMFTIATQWILALQRTGILVYVIQYFQHMIHQKLLIWQTYNGDISAGKITRTFNICIKLCYAQKKL